MLLPYYWLFAKLVGHVQFQAALTGAKTPEAALTEAQAQSDRLLAGYR